MKMEHPKMPQHNSDPYHYPPSPWTSRNVDRAEYAGWNRNHPSFNSLTSRRPEGPCLPGLVCHPVPLGHLNLSESHKPLLSPAYSNQSIYEVETARNTYEATKSVVWSGSAQLDKDIEYNRRNVWRSKPCIYEGAAQDDFYEDLCLGGYYNGHRVEDSRKGLGGSEACYKADYQGARYKDTYIHKETKSYEAAPSNYMCEELGYKNFGYFNERGCEEKYSRNEEREESLDLQAVQMDQLNDRTEALRKLCEDKFGMEMFLHIYRMLNGAAEKNPEEVERVLQELAQCLSVHKRPWLKSVTHLIYCEQLLSQSNCPAS